MELEVIKTEPGVRGDTATNVTKPATLETGAEIKVPLFINEGDRIQVDTRTGEYMFPLQVIRITLRQLICWRSLFFTLWKKGVECFVGS